MKDIIFFMVIVFSALTSSASTMCAETISRLSAKKDVVAAFKQKEIESILGKVYIEKRFGLTGWAGIQNLVFRVEALPHVNKKLAFQSLKASIQKIYSEFEISGNRIIVRLKGEEQTKKLQAVLKLLSESPKKFPEPREFYSYKELGKDLDYHHGKFFSHWPDYIFNRNFRDYLEMYLKESHTRRFFRDNPTQNMNRLIIGLIFTPEIFSVSGTQIQNYRMLRDLGFSPEKIERMQVEVRASFFRGLREYDAVKKGMIEKEFNEVVQEPILFSEVQSVENKKAKKKVEEPSWFNNIREPQDYRITNTKVEKLAFGESRMVGGESRIELSDGVKLPDTKKSSFEDFYIVYEYSTISKISELQISEGAHMKLRGQGLETIPELLLMSVRGLHEQAGLNKAELIEVVQELLVHGHTLYWDAGWDAKTFKIRKDYPVFYNYKAPYHLPAKYYHPEESSSN